jgi:hypothetical protein
MFNVNIPRLSQIITACPAVWAEWPETSRNPEPRKKTAPGRLRRKGNGGDLPDLLCDDEVPVPWSTPGAWMSAPVVDGAGQTAANLRYVTHHQITMRSSWRTCDDGVVAQIEDARTYASLFLQTCGAALQLQYDRVLDLTKAPLDTTDWRALEPDCYLLVLALRQAIVGVKAVAHFEGGSIRSRVDRAMAKRREELSDLKDLRDMLTHFDDYFKGKGFLQPDGIPDPEFDMHRKWRRSRHSGEVLLWVRALGKSVEVLGVSRSVLDLIDEVQQTN